MTATHEVPQFFPEDGNYTMFPHEFYGWMDFSMGAILGIFANLNMR